MSQRDIEALKIVFVVFALCLYISAFSFVFPVRGAQSSVVITDVRPTEFHPGETKEVVLTLRNKGGRDAKDVKLIFEGTDYVSLVGPTVAQINMMNSLSKRKVKITVHVNEGTPNGVYLMQVECFWDESYFDPQEGPVSMPNRFTYIPGNLVEIKPVKLGISFYVEGDVIIDVGTVYTEPAHVRPGDEDVEIHARIMNSGEADAKDVEARLICNEQFKPSWSGTDRDYIGQLDTGESQESLFHVDIADNVNASMYSIPLYIVYSDIGNTQYGIKRSIEVLVERKPEFVIVSSYTEPANISAGDHVILHVRVRNVGSEEAESVSVRVTGEADVPFDFALKSDYAGNLKVNETGDAILDFDVAKEAAKKKYPLGLEIRCVGDRDLGDYSVYTFDRQIQLEVTSSSSSTPGFEGLFSVLVLLFVFLFIKLIKSGKGR